MSCACNLAGNRRSLHIIKSVFHGNLYQLQANFENSVPAKKSIALGTFTIMSADCFSVSKRVHTGWGVRNLMEPRVFLASCGEAHLYQTTSALESRGALAGPWGSGKKSFDLLADWLCQCCPFRLAMKPFYL